MRQHRPGPRWPPGGLALVTTTAGIQPDSDGYTIMVDGTAQGRIGPNDSLTCRMSARGRMPSSFRTSSSIAPPWVSSRGRSPCRIRRRGRGGLFRGLRRALPQPDRVPPGPDRQHAELFLMNADGSELTSLEDSVGADGRNTLLSAISWSADGKRMAFRRGRRRRSTRPSARGRP